MDFQNLGSKASFYKIPLIIFFIGLFVFSIGLGLLVFKSNSTDSNSEVKVLSASDELTESTDIVVDVGGAVNRPGVYTLKADSRVNDAVALAGGLSGEADEARVNLAAKVADGQKVFVPTKTQQLTVDPSTSSGLSNLPFDSSQGKQLTNSQQDSGLVSINSASEKELDTLPGIGPVTAGKIINARPYSSIEELVSKKAVTKSVFEKIKDKISI